MICGNAVKAVPKWSTAPIEWTVTCGAAGAERRWRRRRRSRPRRRCPSCRCRGGPGRRGVQSWQIWSAARSARRKRPVGCCSRWANSGVNSFSGESGSPAAISSSRCEPSNSPSTVVGVRLLERLARVVVQPDRPVPRRDEVGEVERRGRGRDTAVEGRRQLAAEQVVRPSDGLQRTEPERPDLAAAQRPPEGERGPAALREAGDQDVPLQRDTVLGREGPGSEQQVRGGGGLGLRVDVRMRSRTEPQPEVVRRDADQSRAGEQRGAPAGRSRCRRPTPRRPWSRFVPCRYSADGQRTPAPVRQHDDAARGRRPPVVVDRPIDQAVRRDAVPGRWCAGKVGGGGVQLSRGQLWRPGPPTRARHGVRGRWRRQPRTASAG